MFVHVPAAALLTQLLAYTPPGTAAEAVLAPASVTITAAQIAATTLRVLFKPRIGASLTRPFCIPGTQELTRRKTNRQPQRVRRRAFWTIVRALRATQVQRFCTFDVPG